MVEILAFNKWSVEGIKVNDPGLVRYITLKPRIVPKTGARYAGTDFAKSKTFIVERLINKMMIPGHKAKKHLISSGSLTGKSNTAYKIVEDAFGKIEQKTKKNPIQVLVDAIVNAAPREEIVTIEYGGARYPKPLESSPQRRVDITLRQFVEAVYQKSFNKKKLVADILAEELILAAEQNLNSAAIKKKMDLEKQATASR